MAPHRPPRHRQEQRAQIPALSATGVFHQAPRVEYIVVGGVAAILQGSPLTTEDVDVVFAEGDENLGRLASSLGELEAHYLDPAGRHLEPDVGRLESANIHLLKTKYGRLDVLRTLGINSNSKIS